MADQGAAILVIAGRKIIVFQLCLLHSIHVKIHLIGLNAMEVH